MPKSKFSVKYWKDGHILIEAGNWECFLWNEMLNPLVNWMNLHKTEIESGDPCERVDVSNDTRYISIGGNLTIATERDVVFLNKDQVHMLVKWLNEHRDVLKIHEVWP